MQKSAKKPQKRMSFCIGYRVGVAYFCSLISIIAFTRLNVGRPRH